MVITSEALATTDIFLVLAAAVTSFVLAAAITFSALAVIVIFVMLATAIISLKICSTGYMILAAVRQPVPGYFEYLTRFLVTLRLDRLVKYS